MAMPQTWTKLLAFLKENEPRRLISRLRTPPVPRSERRLSSRSPPSPSGKNNCRSSLTWGRARSFPVERALAETLVTLKKG